MSDSARISPTAHYTGYVWCRHGLSPPELATAAGRYMFTALRWPLGLAGRFRGGLTLERMLLQRHHIIDHLLNEAIAEHGVTQIVEVAAGMSGRGLRFTSRHPELVYVEADLPAMAARKRRTLESMGRHASAPPAPRNHHVVAVDALAESGPLSLSESVEPHLREGAVAIVTEGLLNYFAKPQVMQMWRTFAELLAEHGGVYVSDLHLQNDAHDSRFVRGFTSLLGKFARGSLHLHFPTAAAAASALADAGFADGARLVTPRDVAHEVPIQVVPEYDLVSVLRAAGPAKPS